jgi:hypothetical protein
VISFVLSSWVALTQRACERSQGYLITLHPCSIVQLGFLASRSPKKTSFSFNGSPLTQRVCERSQGYLQEVL